MSEKTVLYEYLFGWNETGGALALGNGSLFNHMDDPNLVFDCREEEKCIVYTTIKDVAAGEELTISYRQRFDHENLWFKEAKNIKE